MWEAVNTSNDSWGFAWYDQNWKGSTEIARDLISVVARGGNYMLNVGPRADGTIPEVNAAFLRQVGEWLKQHGETIYGAQPSPWLNALPWGDVTLTGNKVNLFVFDWKAGESIWLPGLETKIKSVTIKSSKEKLIFNHGKDKWVEIQLPLRKKKDLIEVITVELEAKPLVDPTVSVDPGITTIIRADFAETSGCKKGKASWMEKFGEWKHKINVSEWTSDESTATWTINVKTPGKYFVSIEYNAWMESDGSEWDLTTQDGDKLRMYTIQTSGTAGARPRFRNVRMGILEFKNSGKQNLKLSPAANPVSRGMQLHSISLTPAE